jgi:hypothetical protein
MDIRSVVSERYGQLEKCYGHCEQPATLKFLNADGDPVITGYSCHQGYLSRIVLYSDSLDLHQSLATIVGLLGKYQDVREDDVRLASRYPWDFEITTGDYHRLMNVAYWTQNYRRTKSEDPNRDALFLCESCRAVFLHPISGRQVLCPACTSNRLSGP